MFPIWEIAAIVCPVGSLLLAALVYLVKIAARLGSVLDKVDRLEMRLDGQEQIFEKMQVDHERRLSWVEAKVNGKVNGKEGQR